MIALFIILYVIGIGIAGGIFLYNDMDELPETFFMSLVWPITAIIAISIWLFIKLSELTLNYLIKLTSKWQRKKKNCQDLET